MEKTDVKTTETNNDTDGGVYMNFSWLNTAIKISIALTAVALMIITLRVLTDKLLKMEAEDNITQGIVIQHEYVNGYSTILGGYVPSSNRLHVEGEYEYNGETFTGRTYFDVSEEVYNYYADGDYFDSATFLKEISEAQLEEAEN